MKRVYVAGPYAQGDPVLNVRAAVEAGEKLWAAGYAPYVPHTTMLWHLIAPHPPQDWYDLDLEWLLVCDILVRLPGASHGADVEVEVAKEHGIPVYDLDELLGGALGRRPDSKPGPARFDASVTRDGEES